MLSVVREVVDARFGGAILRPASERLVRAGARTALGPPPHPFWHRMGYRPLWSTWEARPAAALR